MRQIAMALPWVWLVGCDGQTEVDTSRPADLAAGRVRPDPLIEEGRVAYTTYCAGCHGNQGDANGPAAGFLHPRPRNFQNANYKFSSARAGRLPTDDDLRRTLVEGLRGSSMPSWRLLPDHTITALIAYIKTFSDDWETRTPGAEIPRVNDPYHSDEDKSKAIARGEAIYHGFATCWTCHPSYVSTDKINEYLAQMESPTRDVFRDDLFLSEVKPNKEGELIYPPDFLRDYVRSGSDVGDLYRSIAAGITGTAMPTWVDSMEYHTPKGDKLVATEDLWAMAYYVQDLIRQRPPLLAPGEFDVRVRPVAIYLDGAPPPAAIEEVQPATEEEFFEEEFFEE